LWWLARIRGDLLSRDRAPPGILSWSLVGRGPEGLCADGDRMANRVGCRFVRVGGAWGGGAPAGVSGLRAADAVLGVV
jgi:hypothetical protein